MGRLLISCQVFLDRISRVLLGDDASDVSTMSPASDSWRWWDQVEPRQERPLIEGLVASGAVR